MLVCVWKAWKVSEQSHSSTYKLLHMEIIFFSLEMFENWMNIIEITQLYTG